MTILPRRLLGLALLALASACQSTSRPVDPLDDLGAHHRAVTTSSAEAQRWFDRGLVLTFAFNHDEAIRCFQHALELDPACCAAWWGIALCNGPHINLPMVDDARAKNAWDALAAARSLAPGANAIERDLLAALEQRYAWPNPQDRKALDQAYADALRNVWHAHSQDADVGALFAEALMDLSPWNQWQKSGDPQPGTLEVLETLDRVLELDPRHPMAHHLKIHALEASRHADAALPSADALRELVPGAGHLVHMPAHIYARVGRWHDAAATNERAIDVDTRYRTLHPRQGFYRIYMAHNRHFLTFACMMEGRSVDALRAAREMLASIPEDFARENAAFVDGYLAIELEVLMRFGRWQEILAQPEPPDWLPVKRALRHFARGSALAALGRVDEAREEQRLLAAGTEKVDAGITIGNNPARGVLAIAGEVLEGEVLAAARDVNGAVKALERAVLHEDELTYDEPPDWIQPARHALGAVLLSAKRFQEAEPVYRADLERYPENGWSLRGLALALRGLGRLDEAYSVETRFKAAWSHADIRIDTSCLCQAGR
jgi:tetratricopeptide (TPR) repeat protein